MSSRHHRNVAKGKTSQRDLVENDGAPGLRVRPRLTRHRSAALDDENLPGSNYRRLLRRIQRLEERVDELEAARSRDDSGS